VPKPEDLWDRYYISAPAPAFKAGGSKFEKKLRSEHSHANGNHIPGLDNENLILLA
jgi:hypothetical protein